MNEVRPGPIVTLVGAVVLLISVFLNWIDISGFGESFTQNGLDTDFFGLIGILLLIMAIAVGVLTGLEAFASGVSMPDKIVGYTPTQLSLVFGVAAFLLGFGLQFSEGTGIGPVIAWIAGAAIIVGTILTMREGAPAAPSGPAAGGEGPSTF